MKKIVYIGRFNGIVGGIERYMMQSGKLLRRHGFQVDYLYTQAGGKDQQHFSAAFDSAAIFSPHSPLLPEADMVIIHNIIAPEYLQFLPEKRTFFFAHDHNIYCQRHHYYWPVGRINCHRKRNRFFCQLCSLGRNPAPPLAEYRKLPAIVLSEFMRENLLKNGFTQVVKMPPFIRIEADDHTFMPDGVLRILFLGQLIRGKGADLLLKALAKVPIPFSCTIAGDGNDRKMLENMVEKLCLHEKIRFTGFVSDPEILWQDCDVFCFPIRWQEPFGLVGLEAMAHGIPAAAFDSGGVSEWLDDRITGALLPEKDIPALTALLTRWAQEPQELARMGKNGTARAEKLFSEENFVDSFSVLMEEIK